MYLIKILDIIFPVRDEDIFDAVQSEQAVYDFVLDF